MEQLLKQAIEGLDVDYAEIRLEERDATVVRYSGRELEEIGRKNEYGGIIRICHNDGWSYVSFNALENLRQKAQLCARQARLIGKGKTELKSVPVVQDKLKTDYRIDPRRIDLKEKEILCRRMNDKILSHSRITTSRVVYRDFYKHYYFINSQDSFIEQELINTGMLAVAFAKDGSNVQRAYRTVGDYHGYENTDSFDQEIDTLLKDTVDLLAADKVEGGIYTVILDPELAGVFTHEAFGHLSEADFIYANPEMRKKMQLGRRFGNDFLNIVDDGSLGGENGFVGFDDEGVAAQKTYLIKGGVLVGRLHSRETAAKMDEEVTGNARAINYRHAPIVRMTNTYIEPHRYSLDQILASVDKGLYVVGALGGQTDLEKFTFSSLKAYKIENGKIGAMVRDVILSGNVFETLANIEMVGDDLKLHGGLGGCGKEGQGPLPVGDGSPHIKIKNVLIGGN